MFAWGVLLAARWYASQVVAFASGQKERKQIEIDIATRNAERESSRLEDIADYKGPRDPKVDLEDIADYKGPRDPKVEAEIERLLAEIRGEKKPEPPVEEA